MNNVRLLIIALVVLGAGLVSRSESTDAAFHIMRVWEVMGGSAGNNQVQYVELRMPVGGQNLIATHEVCFFNEMGVPKVRMEFTANAPNGPIGGSILLGTSEFDAAWAVGSPDYTFGGAGSTMTSLNGGVVTRPVQAPGGKVGFGDYDANCNDLGNIDSVAYGTTGSVTADYGTKLAADLPITGTQAIKYKDTIPFCHPNQFVVCPRSNNADYTVADANTPAGNNPRNNVPQSGPVGGVVVVVPTGDDYYETQAPGAFQTFASPQIPAGFFDPGSDPFTGVLQLEGAPIGGLGTADTIVRRLDTIGLSMAFPASDTVPIEIVALNLVSVNPISVTYVSGPPEQWNVAMSLTPPSTMSQGTMTVTANNASGGTFDSTFQVFPHFTFTRVSPVGTRTLDYGPNAMQVTGAPWRFACPSGAGVLIGPNSNNNFCASVNDTMRVQTDWTSGTAGQRVLPACSDPDADLVTDCIPDNCPNDANPLQENNDGDALGDVCDPDDDNDTILDVTDNCDFDPNLDQANYDADSLGDVCDPDDDNDGTPDVTDTDDDNDGVADIAEGPCGGATPSNLRPERIDGAFVGVDDDGDTAVDEALPGAAAGLDCDGDGYAGSDEDAIYGPTGNRDQDPCGNAGWAPDFVSDDPASANRVNVLDITTYITPIRRLNTSPPEGDYSARWDVVPGPAVPGGFWIDILDLTQIVTLAPPMLGGVRAFQGPSCPWAP